MYDLAKKARAGMKSKAERLAGGKDRKTDSSNWSPAPELNADVKTGMRPVSRRAYKDGGKVADCAPMKRADRKPRKAGGKVEQKGEQPLVDRYINRDLKKANDYRDGKKHIGGLKTGGRAGKLSGGALKRYTEKANEDQDWRYGMLGTLGSDLEGHMFDAKQKWKMKKREKGVDLAEEKLERKGWKRDPDSGHYEPPKDKDDKDGKAHGGRAHKLSGGKLSEYREAASADLSKKLALGDEAGVNRRLRGIKNAANKFSGTAKAGNVDYNYPDFSRKSGGRAKKANGGSMTMEEMIEKNPAPVKKPLGLDKIPLPPRRPANLTPAATNKIKPDESKRMKGDYISPQEIGMKKGGRAKKQDGGPMMMDPRLGIVKPKALEFAQNVVTPGLKKGGRIGKANGGSFGSSAPSAGAGRAPQPLTQAMAGRSAMPAAAMANAQGRPFQAGEKFAPVAPPPRMAAMPIQPSTGGDYPAISTQPIQPRTGGDYPAISTMPAPLPQRTAPMMTTMPVNAIPRKSGGRVAKQIGGALGMSADALAQQQQLPQGSPMQGGTFAPQGMAARPSLPMMPNQAAASPSTLMQPTVNAIGRKSGGRTNAKGKTNINIIITAGSKKEPESMVPTPPPAPMGVPPMPAPEMPASPEMPPMPPPAAMMGGAPMGGGSPMMGGDMMPPPPVPRRAGGRVSKVAHSFKDMTAGSGSGEGRLQKTDIAKRSAHKAGGKVYRSYKDMDAGAGSGKGRMEKTEIQSRKK